MHSTMDPGPGSWGYKKWTSHWTWTWVEFRDFSSSYPKQKSTAVSCAVKTWHYQKIHKWQYGSCKKNKDMKILSLNQEKTTCNRPFFVAKLCLNYKTSGARAGNCINFLFWVQMKRSQMIHLLLACVSHHLDQWDHLISCNHRTGLHLCRHALCTTDTDVTITKLRWHVQFNSWNSKNVIVVIH